MTLRLVDVSRYQVERPDPIDLAKAKVAGYHIANVALTGSRGYTSGAWAAVYLARAQVIGIGRCTYHWLHGQTSGAAQAATTVARLRALFGNLGPGFAHIVDVEETGANGVTPPTWAHVRDYVTAVQAALGRPIGIYTGDWWWQPRGWDGASLTPYLMAAPNERVAGPPADTSPAWRAGYGGWTDLSVMQWGVRPLPGTGDCSLSVIRDHAVWAALTGGDTLAITTRAQWGARAATKPPVHVAPSKRVYFVVHHSGAAATQTVRAIQDWCMDGRGFSDIDYNHLVRGTTGEIYEGRGWDVAGAHTANYNTNGVGVCVIGNDQISDAAKRSVRWLYQQYNQRSGHTLNIRGHRQLATTGTSCPGDRIFAWVQAGMPDPGNPQEDDVSQADVVKALQSDEGRAAIAAAVNPDVVQRYDLQGVAIPKTDTNPTVTPFSALANIMRDVAMVRAGTAASTKAIGAAVASLAGKDFVDEDAVVAGVLTGLGAGRQPAEVAAILRAVPGVDWDAVGQVLTTA